MVPDRFQTLCEGLHGALGVPLHPLWDGHGTASVSMKLDGVNITVAHFPQRSPHSAVALVEFGQIPQRQELAAWQALLKINFLMRGSGAMSFGRSPHGGAAILQCSYCFAQVTAAGLVQSLRNMVQLARSWRLDYFLEATPPRDVRLAPRPGRPGRPRRADRVARA